MQLLQQFFNIFYPNSCVMCCNSLLKNEQFLCTFCNHNLPVIELKDYEKNEISSLFYGRIPIKKAVAFLYFRKGNTTQKLIHELKYKNNQAIGSFIGNWFGYELKKQEVFNNLDYIIPVPLHPKKEKQRGYNQVTSFGKSLSKSLEIEYIESVLCRVSSAKTQTLKSRFERFSNLSTKFLLTDTQIFENKHVLLIDDVVTTGATLEACCNELLKTKNITISIATIALSEIN